MPSSPTTRKPRNCLWIPILLCLFNELSFAEAESSTILLPSQQHNADSVSTTFCAHCPAPDPSLNYRPVIGILSHPGDGASGRLSNATNASYISASYVKFAESGGARVIPLIFNEPEEILFEKLELVNGILYTGGWAKNGLYYDIVEKIFKKILEKNDAGDHFPVYAICLGFELLSMIVSELNGSVGSNKRAYLVILLCLLSILTSVINHYQVYVSTVQAYNYPVTAFQWHPQKNDFEWGPKAIPHIEDAIRVTQQAANFFISEARKSSNRPPTRKVLDNLIYNYSPTYCGKAGKGYDEVYIFT
ncbi:gamma-glutamyl hydrolase 2 [Citrus sinensis]|nr:gamma-glutamyl hydrolase 2 [Citrus sinensis]